MENEWYIQIVGGGFEGPLSSAMLKRRAIDGVIGPNTLVRKGANDNWTSASRVKGLFTISPPSPPAEKLLPIQWYVTIEGEQKGPLTDAEMERWVSQGKVNPNTFVRQGVDREWAPASDFSELFAGQSQPTPDAQLPIASTNDPRTRDYQTTVECVFNAAVRAVRDLGYKVDSLDKNNGLINFKSGLSWLSWAGQEMSVLILDSGNGTCSMRIAGRRNQTGVVIQTYDFGEVGQISKKIFAALEAFLPPSALPAKDPFDDTRRSQRAADKRKRLEGYQQVKLKISDELRCHIEAGEIDEDGRKMPDVAVHVELSKAVALGLFSNPVPESGMYIVDKRPIIDRLRSKDVLTLNGYIRPSQLTVLVSSPNVKFVSSWEP